MLGEQIEVAPWGSDEWFLETTPVLFRDAAFAR